MKEEWNILKKDFLGKNTITIFNENNAYIIYYNERRYIKLTEHHQRTLKMLNNEVYIKDTIKKDISNIIEIEKVNKELFIDLIMKEIDEI